MAVAVAAAAARGPWQTPAVGHLESCRGRFWNSRFRGNETEFFCAVDDFAASALSGAEPVETLLLLVAERAVKLLERRLHGLHRA